MEITPQELHKLLELATARPLSSGELFRRYTQPLEDAVEAKQREYGPGWEQAFRVAQDVLDEYNEAPPERVEMPAPLTVGDVTRLSHEEYGKLQQLARDLEVARTQAAEWERTARAMEKNNDTLLKQRDSYYRELQQARSEHAATQELLDDCTREREHLQNVLEQRQQSDASNLQERKYTLAVRAYEAAPHLRTEVWVHQDVPADAAMGAGVVYGDVINKPERSGDWRKLTLVVRNGELRVE